MVTWARGIFKAFDSYQVKAGVSEKDAKAAAEAAAADISEIHVTLEKLNTNMAWGRVIAVGIIFLLAGLYFRDFGPRPGRPVDASSVGAPPIEVSPVGAPPIEVSPVDASSAGASSVGAPPVEAPVVQADGFRLLDVVEPETEPVTEQEWLVMIERSERDTRAVHADGR